MAKTIKFNLICDGNPIRRIEDLTDNFSIEDVLAYYENGLLKKWLKVRGYTEHLEKVEEILTENQLDIIKALIGIFEIELDENKVKEDTYILEYKMKREYLIDEYKKNNYDIESIIDDYHQGYDKLVQSILENQNNLPEIKAAIKELIENYSRLIKMDFRNLFNLFYSKAPKAIYVMLMNDELRSYYLPENNNAEDSDRIAMYKQICKLNDSELVVHLLGDDLKKYSGNTQEYWKDVEPKGRKFMILSMERGKFVRSAGVNGGDLGHSDVWNKFVILDGIDYKSNNVFHELLYLEV